MHTNRIYALACSFFLVVVSSALIYVRAGGQIPPRPAITFSLVTPKASLYEPVYVEFVLHNNTADSISLDLGDNRKGAFRFAITSPSGRKEQVPPLIKIGEGIVGSGKLILKQNETYRQRLLVNEWYRFRAAGKYLVELDLPIQMTAKGGATFTAADRLKEELQITKKDAQRLDAVCNELTERALAVKNLQESIAEATALSYILDPVAVPYLEKLLRANKALDGIAIVGLAKIGERIGGEQAVQALLSALDMKDKETAMLAAQTLYNIKNRIGDPALRNRVDQAISNFAASDKR